MATQPSQGRNPLSHQEKPKAGASWKAAERHVLPYNRLGIVVPGLMACISLTALDQTIVAIALPTIVEELGEGKNYSWVGSAYLLASCAISPLCGKLSDLIGRKPVLYSSIFIFILGSALCVGSGGIIQLVLITISDIVSLESMFDPLALIYCVDYPAHMPKVVANMQDSSALRGAFQALLGLSLGVLSLIMCFWINLPIGGFAGVMLFFFLNLNPHQNMTLQQHLSQFDFLGLGLLMSGAVCVLIGLNSGETSWSSAETIALICVGCTLLILAAMNEILTTRSPILPPRLFKTRTTGIILISCFLHAVTYYSGAYYLPLYFQVLGSSATGAAIRMIPFSVGAATISAVSSMTVTRTGAYRGIIWVAWAIMTLGWGLMITLDDHSNTAEKVLYPFITAAGIGCLFQPPLTALQAAMPLKDMATSTGAYGFLRYADIVRVVASSPRLQFRTMGGTVALSIGQAIYSSILKRKINRMPNLSGFNTSPAALSESVRTLQHLPQPEKGQIIHAYAQSISAIWVFNAPVVGVGFVMVLFIKAYSLQRTTIQQGDTHSDYPTTRWRQPVAQEE
ncbi:major facilitator superfamily domain-containing protein [Lactarius quietus]|nr:major facilitator superfamily domain-containing protein [Lactarius quietus]